MGNHQLKTFTEMETLIMSIIERFVTLSIKKYKQQDKINKQTIQINELTSNLQLTRRQFRQAEHQFTLNLTALKQEYEEQQQLLLNRS